MSACIAGVAANIGFDVVVQAATWQAFGSKVKVNIDFSTTTTSMIVPVLLTAFEN
jgi:hypothetical protein